jgi:hypothetical protein
MTQTSRQSELAKWSDILARRTLTRMECYALRKVLTHTSRFIDYAYRENRRLAARCNEQAELEDV